MESTFRAGQRPACLLSRYSSSPCFFLYHGTTLPSSRFVHFFFSLAYQRNFIYCEESIGRNLERSWGKARALVTQKRFKRSASFKYNVLLAVVSSLEVDYLRCHGEVDRYVFVVDLYNSLFSCGEVE